MESIGPDVFIRELHQTRETLLGFFVVSQRMGTKGLPANSFPKAVNLTPNFPTRIQQDNTSHLYSCKKTSTRPLQILPAVLKRTPRSIKPLRSQGQLKIFQSVYKVSHMTGSKGIPYHHIIRCNNNNKKHLTSAHD